MRILLVDADVIVADALYLTLKSSQSTVDHAHTGEEALDLMLCNTYDIVVIDPMLPGIEGYDVIRTMRDGGNDMPVVITSGLSRPEATVMALGAGADDFIAKPFDKDELLARMQAVLRRTRRSLAPTMRIGSVQLNRQTHDVTVGDKPVALTGKQFAILEILFLRRGSVLTKEALVTHLYGGMDVPEIKIIDVFVCKLRKKLAQAGAGNLITTVWGRGYKMNEPSNAMGLRFDRTPAPDRSIAPF